jgi:AcrR family transcriptional regulator
MKPQLRQPTASRQAEIVATMVHLSAARNPTEITTGDIAQAIGVTQGALFRHYPSKEAIRLAVVDWIEARLMGELTAARAAAADPRVALAAMFRAHVRFTCDHPGVPRLVFAELQEPETSPVRQRVRALMQRYRQTLAAVLAQARADGLIRGDVDCAAAAGLFLGAIQGLVIQQLLGGAPGAAEQQAEGVLQLYLTGLGEAS